MDSNLEQGQDMEQEKGTEQAKEPVVLSKEGHAILGKFIRELFNKAAEDLILEPALAILSPIAELVRSQNDWGTTNAVESLMNVTVMQAAEWSALYGFYLGMRAKEAVQPGSETFEEWADKVLREMDLTDYKLSTLEDFRS